MPAKKIYRKRKPRAYKKKFYKRQPLYKQLNSLKKKVAGEVHKYDGSLGTTAYDVVAGPTITHLTAIEQGDNYTQRTGNQVRIKSVDIKGYTTFTSGALTSQIVKIYLIMDKQQVGDTLPTFGDIFTTTQGINFHMNPLTVGRFKILAIKTVIVDADDTVKQFNIFKKIFSKIRYNGTSSTDIQKNGIYVFSISNQPTANQPTISASFRVSFYDN